MEKTVCDSKVDWHIEEFLVIISASFDESVWYERLAWDTGSSPGFSEHRMTLGLSGASVVAPFPLKSPQLLLGLGDVRVIPRTILMRFHFPSPGWCVRV